MKIDPQLIQTLLAMPDDQLWATVRAFASTKKITLSKETPPKETMQALRGAFGNADKFDLGQAVKILSSYRQKK